MKNRSLVYVLAAAGAAFLLSAGPSIAMNGEGAMPPLGGPGMGEEHGKRAWKDDEKALGLTPEQRTQMKAVREGAREKHKPLRAQVKAQHDALRKELDGDAPDRAKAEGIVMEISKIEQQLALSRIDQIFEIRKILTPEQDKQLRALHEKKKAGFDKKRLRKHKQGSGE